MTPAPGSIGLMLIVRNREAGKRARYDVMWLGGFNGLYRFIGRELTLSHARRLASGKGR